MPQNDRIEQSIWQQMISNAPRFLFLYFLLSFMMNSSKGIQEEKVTTRDDSSNTDSKPEDLSLAQRKYLPHPLWSNRRATEKSLSVYFDVNSSWNESTAKMLVNSKIPSDGNWEKNFSIPCNEKLLDGSLYFAHVFLTLDDENLDGNNQDDAVLHLEIPLVRRLPKKIVEKKNLLSKQRDKSVVSNPDEPISLISYWQPVLNLHSVSLETAISVKDHPPTIQGFFKADKSGKFFMPIFYNNNFWILQDDLVPINSSVSSLNLTISYSMIAFWRFQLEQQFDESLRIQTEVLGSDKADADRMKRIFIDTNPYLLATTLIVSLLHSLFDFLAFKNDIKFWQDKKALDGISFRSIVLNVFCQLVILLYLMDSDTSYMILVSNGIGLLIEFWKIQKVAIIKSSSEFPYFQVVDRVKPSELTQKGQLYDRMAFEYLSVFIFPALLFYTIYSLVYNEHKSWYSFILGTLVGFVYSFGFIAQTPQLFVNYKLKSVAHMPLKTFIYKALNTFIDDLFAFVIKMPMLHRIACLRDDVVFLVYLYQRHIYKEDKTRRNEFGQVGEDEKEPEEQAKIEPSAVADVVKSKDATSTIKRHVPRGERPTTFD